VGQYAESTKTEMDIETSVYNVHLTRLIAREDFIKWGPVPMEDEKVSDAISHFVNNLASAGRNSCLRI
jgi:hypothetical protein